ncbi:hypothetical protein JQC91_06240 [Jannaschia sp. Os4]|uniref:hypothetical protein n=1 Tax=Jannaschia sp. Os4 TaxID=2807617 RepID=UPI001939C965|nr:hypothetical protein [Jannaschia sp. Os4]MBM2575897.1 hypothetical protein [Jannaschia sp. Os4]
MTPSTGLRVGTMATFPARFGIIREVVASIAPQLDRLYLYVNETTDGLPDLSDLGDVVVVDGRAAGGDLSANGKIWPLRLMTDCQVFVLDDDFLFPPAYVARTGAVLDAFDQRCCVTTHASVLPAHTDWYYERNVIWMSTRPLRHAHVANLAGSGTFAFHQSTLPLDAEAFFENIMVDLRLSLAARAADLPIWVLPRAEGWLRNLKTPGLFALFTSGVVTHHSEEARRHDWSFDRYAPMVRAALDRLGDDAAARAVRASLDPDLVAALEEGRTPMAWAPSRLLLEKQAEYLDIVEEIRTRAPEEQAP